MKELFSKIKYKIDEGFTIIELLISMGLLAFVMSISMNVLYIVLSMTSDADYSIVVTQESNYAAERIKRLVRSADEIYISEDGDTLSISLDEKSYVIKFIDNDGDNQYLLMEGDESIMSSEVFATPIEIESSAESFFSEVNDGSESLGVRMAFNIFHKQDSEKSSGAVTYIQAIRRNAVLE